VSFPAAGLPPPSLGLYQMSYQGLAFGGVQRFATYQFQELPEGLGPPDYVTGDVQRALEQGEYEGLDLSPGRNVVVKQVIQAATPVGLDEARQALAGVLGPGGAVEQPLYIHLPSGLFTCMARPRKHSPPLDVKAVLAHAHEVATSFHATDPRWYGPTQTATIGLPAPSIGITPPVTPPVTIGSGGTGGLVEVVNSGKFETLPRVTFTGPCKVPKVANLSLEGAPSLAFDVDLNPGDALTLDLDWGSVVLVSAGTTGGSSRRNTEVPGNTWFNAPGVSETFDGISIFEFTSEDTEAVAGTMTVEWAPAWMGI
jgi:hypothetical protein